MSEYSATAPSSMGPRSPVFGTATYTEVADTRPPSRASSSALSYTEATPSVRGDDDSSISDMRRLNMSPVPSTQETDSDTHSYSEEASIDERAEVEAALTAVEDELEDTLDLWTRGPAALERDRRVLSMISEHTENLASRPTSYALAGPRPASQSSGGVSSEGRRPTAPAGPILLHARASTEPSGPRPYPPAGGVRNIVAKFEAKGTTPDTMATPTSSGHSRTASAPSGPRSPSPYTTTSFTPALPALSSFTPFAPTTTAYTNTGYGSATGYGSSTSYGSRPTSPTKSRGSSTISGPRAPTSTSRTTPSTHTRTTSHFTGTSRSLVTTFTGLSASSALSVTNTETATGAETKTNGSVTSGSSPTRRTESPPREPLAQVKNIVAAWKKMQPERAKASTSSVSPSPRQNRRRSTTPRNVSSPTSSRVGRSSHVTTPEPVSRRGAPAPSTPESQSATGYLPSDFSMPNLGLVGEPIDIGQLWYLNVHAPEPFRWQRCQAMLYRHVLVLTWITQTGARGTVTLDLLNCTEVQSVPSPTHALARDDIGTIAARRQSENAQRGGPGAMPGDLSIMEILTPFHLLYSDGIERVAAESPRERLQWTSAIMDVLALPIPSDPSETASIKTTRTMASTDTSRSHASIGSASTNYIAPLSPSELADVVSLSGSSSLSRRPSMTTLSSRVMDDSAISGSTYLPHADRRVIPPSRMSSLRRTSSMTDMDESFNAALRLARTSRGGLGFGMNVAGMPLGDGAPVTISSGSQLGRDVSLTPPPRSRASSRTRTSEADSTSTSDNPFLTAQSGTESGTSATSWHSTSQGTSTQTGKSGFAGTGTMTAEPLLGVHSETATEIIPSTLSRRGPGSASLLGDSHTGSSTSLGTSRNGLTRSGGIRRRTGTSSGSRTFTTSYISGTEETSDKENSDSRSRSATDSVSYPSTFSTLESLTHSDTHSSSEYARSSSRSPTPTPSSVSSRRPPSEHTESSETPSSLPPPPSSSGSSAYVTSKSPAASFSSLPSIPSESDFVTAAVCSPPSTAPSDFITADVCLTETEFQTAEVCSLTASSDFVTCEVCGSEIATEYGTAMCHCVRSPAVSEASIPTIPSLVPDEQEEEVHPEAIPLPESTVSVSSLTPSSPLSPPSLPRLGPRVPTPSTPEPPLSGSSASSRSVRGPSPPGVPLILPTLATVSSLTSLTETSVTMSSSSEPSLPSLPTVSVPSVLSPTVSVQSVVAPPTVSVSASVSAPSVASATVSPSSRSVSPVPPRSLTVPSTVPSSLPRSITPSSPSIPESLWAAETDRSYDSSILRASPSAQSMAIPEPLDTSFETSFLRPTTMSSREPSLSTPISGTPTPSTLTVVTTSSLSVTPSPTSPMPTSRSATFSPSAVSPVSPTPSPVSQLPSPLPTPRFITSSPSAITPVSPSPSPTPTPSVSVRSPSVVSATPSSISSVSSLPETVTVRDLPDVGEPEERSPSTVPSLLSAESTPRAAPSPLPIPPQFPPVPISVVEAPLPVRSPGPAFPIPAPAMPGFPTAVPAAPGFPTAIPAAPEFPIATPAVPAWPTPAPAEPAFPPPVLEEPAYPRAASPASSPPSTVPPSSPAPPTPSLSASVSVSTPRGSTPSVRSLLDTVPSESAVAPAPPPPPPPVPQIPNLDGFLRFLQDADQLRGEENRELRDAVHEIRDLLGDVYDEVRRQGERPPPLPQKDRSVGESSPLIATPSLETIPSLPAGPSPPRPVMDLRDVPQEPKVERPPSVPPIQARSGPSPIELSPPRLRVPSPDSSIETMSYLSSHHSDDYSLMEEEPYPVEPSSPQWPSDSSSTTSSPQSVRRVVPSRTPTPSLVSDSSTPSRPQSPASSATVRPVPQFSLADLRAILDGLRNQMGDLANGQDAANRMLDEVRQRPPVVQRDVPDVSDRLARIEALLQDLLERPITMEAPRAAPAPAPAPAPPQPPPEEETETMSSDTSSLYRYVRDIIGRGRHEGPAIHMPAPVRATGPSLSEQLADLLSTGPHHPAAPVEPPPPLVNLIYRPIPRASRPRSASPTFDFDLPPRAQTAPPDEFPEPVREYRRPRPLSRRGPPSGPPSEAPPPPGQPPRQPPPSGQAQAPPPPPGTYTQAPTSVPATTVRDDRGSGYPIDMDRAVRNRRRDRQPGSDGWYNTERPGRPPSAPADLDTDRRSGLWYAPPVVAPVPPPAQRPPGAGGPPVPPPGTVQPGAAPGVFQLPASLEDIVELLRESRLAQSATLEQQQEITRYVQQLNDWLSRDVESRQQEIRAVTARVDHLAELIRALVQGEGRPGPGPGPGPGPTPGTQTFFPPPGTVTSHPGPPGMPAMPGMPSPVAFPEPAVRQPVIPPLGGPFGPISTPQQPPGFTPVIPARPQPGTPYFQGPSEYSDESDVVPDRPRDDRPVIPQAVIPEFEEEGAAGPSRRRHRPHTTDYTDEGSPVVPPRPQPRPESDDYSTDLSEEVLPVPGPGMFPPQQQMHPPQEVHRLSRTPSTSESGESEDMIIQQPGYPAQAGPVPPPPGGPGVVFPQPVPGGPEFIVAPPGPGHPPTEGPIVIQPMPPGPIPYVPSPQEHLERPQSAHVHLHTSPSGSPTHVEYNRPQSRSRTPSSRRSSPRIQIIPSERPGGEQTIVIQPPAQQQFYPPPQPQLAPTQVILPTAQSASERRRTRSHSGTRSRSRSPSPDHPLIIHTSSHPDEGPRRRYEDEHRPHRSRSRSRSRSPSSRSPRDHRRRSRSRSGSPRSYREHPQQGPIIIQPQVGGEGRQPTMIVRSGRGESRSRSPPIIIGPSGTRRSHSPVVVTTHRTRSRSHSPTAVIVHRTESRSRSRSPIRVHRTHRTHSTRSRTPEYEDRPRHRHGSPSRTVRTEGSRHDQPIVVEQPRTRSRSPVILHTRRSRSHSPTRIIRTGTSHRSRSRTPPPIILGSRRSRSRSPTRIIGTGASHRSRSRTPPPIILGSRRSRSRSPTRIIGTGASHRSRSRTPPPIVLGSRRSRSRSPTRIIRTGASHRSRSRTPPNILDSGRHSRSPTRVIRTHTSRRSHSRTPPTVVGDRPRSRSRSPTRIIRTHRSRSRSPERSERRRSRSPTIHFRREPSDRDRPLHVPESARTHRSHRTGSPSHAGRTSRSPSLEYDSEGRPIRLRRSPERHAGYTSRTPTYVESRRSRSPTVHRRTPSYDDTGRPVRMGRSRSPTSLRATSTHAPQYVQGASHPSRQPTYIEHPEGVEPIRVVVRSPSRTAAGSVEREASGRRPGLTPSGFSGGVPPHVMRRSRSPSIAESALPVPGPTIRTGRRGRSRSPTIVPIPSQERLSHPGEVRPTVIRTGTPSHVGRIPASPTVSEHHFPESHPITIPPSRTPSRVSELERAFSDEGAPIPVDRITVPPRRRVSPRTEYEDSIRRARPEVPFIPMEPGARQEADQGARGPHEGAVPVPPPVTHVTVPGVTPGGAEPHIRTTTGQRPGSAEPHIDTTAGRVPVPGPVTPGSALPVPPPATAAPVPTVEPITVRPTSPRGPRETSAPLLDLAYADAERDRLERFGDLERQFADQLQLGQEAEERRDQDFRMNEEERERIFLERQNQRDQEIQQRGDAIFRAIEDKVDERLAELPSVAPLPVPPPHEGPPRHEPRPHEPPPEVIREEEDIIPGSPRYPPSGRAPSVRTHAEELEEEESILRTIRSSMHSPAMEAASRHAQEILETVRLEREELAREREAAREEADRIFNEYQRQREQIEAEQKVQIDDLRRELTEAKEQLAAAQASLEQERAMRISDDTQRRESDRDADRQRAEDLATQLNEVTTVVSETRDELARKREASDERWAQQEVKQVECNTKMDEMKDMLAGMRDLMSQMQNDQAAQREAEAAKPSVESILEELRNENLTLRDLLQQLADGWRADSQRQHEDLLNNVRATAQQQVPFNVGRYLDDFSKSLSREVRQLLTEVNGLAEEKTRLQFEIATLLEFRARYDQGGFFWRPGVPMPPPAAAPEPPQPEPAPPAPTAADPVPGAWRAGRPGRRDRRRARESVPAAPAGPAFPMPVPAPPPPAVPQMVQMPVVGERRAGSWNTWQPDPGYQPSEFSEPPVQVSAELLTPQPAPGLFGPRSPATSR